MRNYQYMKEEEEQMDAFANEWKKTNRGIKGPSAWREFKRRHPWAKRITADALRQKYTRLKRDQYWRAYAISHNNCPRGHSVCYANPNNQPDTFQRLLQDIDNYVSRSTVTIPMGSPLPNKNEPTQANRNGASSPTPSSSSFASTSSSPTVVPSNASATSSNAAVSDNNNNKPQEVVKDDVAVELDPNKIKKAPTDASTSQESASSTSGKVAQQENGDDAFLKLLKQLLAGEPTDNQKKQPDTEAAKSQSLPVDNALNSLKPLIESVLNDKFKQIEDKMTTTGAPSTVSKDQMLAVLKQLKGLLGSEFEKLIEKMKKPSK